MKWPTLLQVRYTTRLEKLKLPAEYSSVFAQVDIIDQLLVRISLPMHVLQPVHRLQSRDMISVKATGNRQSDARKDIIENASSATITVVNEIRNLRILNRTKLREAMRFFIKRLQMVAAER